MKCPKCQFQIPAGMKFCGNCGSKLGGVCLSCGFENPPGFKFCGSCGSTLGTAPHGPVESAAPDDPASSEETEKGERRHLTVMFCDLVGSTELSHQLDPEDLRTIIKEYQSICASIITRFDGHIAQYLGDGIMAYFGYPAAHENDGQRAASSAIGILEAIRKFKVDIRGRFGESIDVRIGIHTGNVVISQIGGGKSAQDLALGATPNIAARLEGLASPGTALVSDSTYELIGRYFNCEALGPRSLKGVAHPISVYRVISANIAKYRYDEQISMFERTPLFGRDEETMQLHALWEIAGDGEPQIVTLHGEPGIGKSRIVDMAMQLSSEDPNAWIMFHQCSEYHSNSAFYPIAQAVLHSALQLRASDPTDEKISRLEAFLLQAGFEMEEMMPLFAQMMSLSLSGTKYQPSPYSPDQQRHKLIDAVIRNYVKRSSNNRLLLIFEDLQWIDQATLQIINRLLQDCSGLKLLVLLTYRPGYHAQWESSAQITDLEIRHLRKESSNELISRIAGGKRLPDELMEEIINKTDGIPLFVEELTKTILNSDIVIEKDDRFILNKPLSQISIPSTIHDSLEARLDRMSHTKEVAQLGASIGRVFDYRLLVEVSTMEEDSVRSCLSELVDAQLLVQTGLPPESVYQFRHALIMDAAYASLLKSNRVIIHRRIAQAMSTMGNYNEEVPDAIALHYLKAGDFTKSARYWTKAASKARRYQSFEEALVYIDKGLQLLNKVNGDQKIRIEADLLEMKAPTHLSLESFGSSNAYQASLRLYELGNRLDDNMARFNALRTMLTYEVFSGRPDSALGHAEAARELADQIGTTYVRIEASRLYGLAAMYYGKYADTVESFEAAYRMFEELEGKERTPFSKNQGILSLVQSSHCLWYLGYPDKALARGSHSVQLADENGVMHLLAMAYFLQCINLGYVGKWNELLTLAEKGLAVADEYGFRMMSSETRFQVGAAKAMLGEKEEGVAMMKASIQWRTSVGLFSAIHLQTSTLAECLIGLGRYDEAREFIDKSMKLISVNEDQFFRSEIYRVAALLQLKTGGDDGRDEAKKLIETSLRITRDQGIRSLELRTCMSALEVAEEPDNVRHALDDLQMVYSWFEEGFDSMDLQKASRLLLDHSGILQKPA